ncbi:MAG: Rnf-Nqr domain containing protein [Clostridia bacterium]
MKEHEFQEIDFEKIKLEKATKKEKDLDKNILENKKERKKFEFNAAKKSIGDFSIKTKKKMKETKKTFINSSDKTKRSKFNLPLAIFKGGYVHNPVLTQILGVCPIVMLATSVLNSINVTVIVTLMLVVCEVITSQFLKRVPRWVRVSLYAIIATIVVTPVYILMVNMQTLSMAFSIYLPLLSVNGLIVIKCEKFACKTSVKNSFYDAIATGVGFGAVALVIGALREIFVNGSIFNISFASLDQLPSSTMPFITLVLLGFLSAAHKYSVMKHFPNETTDTFELNQVFEKVSYSENGIETKKKNTSKKMKENKPKNTPKNMKENIQKSTPKNKNRRRKHESIIGENTVQSSSMEVQS